MKALHMITFTLLVIGGLNWLAQGAFGWDVSQLLGGMESTAARVIYVLVGLSAIVQIFSHKGDCKCCASKTGMPQ